MFVLGPITARLLSQLPADDPAWTPPRATHVRPLTATATGWPCTGRTDSLTGHPAIPPADFPAQPGQGPTPGEAGRETHSGSLPPAGHPAGRDPVSVTSGPAVATAGPPG